MLVEICLCESLSGSGMCVRVSLDFLWQINIFISFANVNIQMYMGIGFDRGKCLLLFWKRPSSHLEEDQLTFSSSRRRP